MLADEILWRAHLSPRRPAGDLSTDELDRLRRDRGPDDVLVPARQA